MKTSSSNYFYLLVILLITSCDALQHTSGVVLDARTHLPLDSVALGKHEKEDTSNSFTKRIYTDEKGHFDYSSVGMTNNFKLYFSKKGYQLKKVKINAKNPTDTIYLNPIHE